MRRLSAFLLAALAASMLSLVGAPPSPAQTVCKNPPLDPRSELLKAEVAFVGEIDKNAPENKAELEKRPNSGGFNDYELTIRIDRVEKGSLPGTTVRAMVHQCVARTETTGRYLVKEAGKWRVTSSPPVDIFDRALQPLPDPVKEDGVVVAASGIGNVRAVLLSEAGNIVAYGTGNEKVATSVSVCPELRHAVFASDDSVMIRTLPDLRNVNSRRTPKGDAVVDVSCRDAAGNEVWLYRTDGEGKSQLVSMKTGESKVVWSGDGGERATFTGSNDVFFSVGTNVVRVNMSTGKATTHPGLHGHAPQLTRSPDDKSLAGMVVSDSGGGQRVELALIDQVTGKARHYTSGSAGYRRVLWLDAGRIATVPDPAPTGAFSDERADVRVYNASSLSQLSVSGYPADSFGPVSANGRIYGQRSHIEGYSSYGHTQGVIRSIPGQGNAIALAVNLFDTPFFGPLAALERSITAPGNATVPDSSVSPPTTDMRAAPTASGASTTSIPANVLKEDFALDDDGFDSAAAVDLALLLLVAALYLLYRRIRAS